MKLPDVPLADIAVIGTYAAAVWIPGAALAAAAGLRRWQLVTLAPLFTYALAGLLGPLCTVLGLRWSAWALLIGVALVVAGVFGARLLLRRVSPPAEIKPAETETDGTTYWGSASWGVAVAAVAAFGVGVVAILGGIGSLSALPQDWDAVFHANGIRLIMDTGDGGVFAMGRTNWYEDGLDVFYPNAYHLLAATVAQLTGAAIPVVLNAHTVLIPGLIGLSLIGVVQRLGGSPVLAGSAALAIASTSAVYDMFWRGPLLPFATGVAILPLAIVLLSNLFDSISLRTRVGPALLLSLGAAGLLCIHPAILISGVLFAIPFVAVHWWTHPRAILRDLAALVVAGAATIGLALLQVRGAMSSAGILDLISWPADVSVSDALGQILLYSHAGVPQWGLATAMVLGLFGYRTLGRLSWVAASATIFGFLFVITASSEATWVKTITGVWWNDRWRLIALTAVPLAIIAGHGVDMTFRLLSRVLTTIRLPRALPIIAAATVVLVLFGLITRGFYVGRDQFRMRSNVGDGPAVSLTELDGIRAAAAFVPPGSRVLNDRGDGSAWMYALTGLRPVAGHYDPARIGPDARLLAQRFNQYDTDSDVRRAVETLDVRYVMINKSFLRPGAHRQAGLTGLDRAGFLQVVYRNPDVVLYVIEPRQPTKP